MKNRDKLIQIYKDKINILKDHNYQYYILSKPKIADSEYDKLKFEILEMEKKTSNSKKIWFNGKNCWLSAIK